MTPEQRAAATREFLGLGAKPDKEAAGRGAPLFRQNCAFCHGPQARGATGPSLITSDVVLDDDHGVAILPYTTLVPIIGGSVGSVVRAYFLLFFCFRMDSN